MSYRAAQYGEHNAPMWADLGEWLDDFHKRCADAEHTDTGEAWEILTAVRSKIAHEGYCLGPNPE